MRYRGIAMGWLLAGMAGIALAAPAGPPDRIFSGAAGVGIRQSYLDIETRRDCELCPGAPLAYETEGINVYEFYGHLNIWGGPVFEFTYQQPFEQTDSQDELLRANRSGDSSYEKVAAGLILDSFADRYLAGEELSMQILRRLASIKFTRTEEVFLGEVKVKADAEFIPIDGLIDYNSNTILTGSRLSAGQLLTFQTKYSDTEMSFALFTLDKPQLHVTPGVFRVGYYWASWRRLTDAQISSLSSNPIVYEAEFDTEGIMAVFEPKERTAPGLNVNLAAKIGTDNTIKAPIDWARLTGSDVDIKMNMIKCGLWYNYYFNRETRRGWAVTAGGSLDLRQTDVDTGSSAFGQNTVSTNRDLIMNTFVSTAYRF